jgi:hypothetical protein
MNHRHRRLNWHLVGRAFHRLNSHDPLRQRLRTI